MNEQLRLLIDLQEIDTLIINSKAKISTIPQKIAAFDGPIKAARAALEKSEQQLQAAEKKKKDRDQEINDLKDKISRLKARSSEIKNNKEYQAHLKEIENTEKILNNADESLNTALELINTLSKDIGIQQDELKSEEAKINTIKDDLSKEAAEAEEELKSVIEKRRAFVKQFDKSTYELYMGILKTKRGVAVVNTANEVCSGCNMHIPPQMFAEIKTNKELNQCPQCRRILYFTEIQNAES
ncbi:MAG: C4-type zinc ribbon domain-containing protein [Dissulfurispiraceae bacterium]|nr:C4-type zinc ribbon domain-containing protein [Dissulfurispiraceae bacterium]